MSLPPPLPHILSVDVEDYFQVSAFEHRITRDEWPTLPCRVEASTDRLLQLFADHDVHGTFFVLGWVARRYPELVRRIAQAGHELASHGYWHRLVYDLTPEAFRQDIRDSREAIGDAAGVAVTAYRAPSFSITERSMWALDVLVEEGFTVDSSIFPIRHDRYGVPDARPEVHQRQTAAGPIVEVPPTVGTLGKFKVPIGGGYFRLFPLAVTQRAIDSVAAQQRPAMLYLHPWEIDPDQPRIEGVGMRSRFRHYVGLRRTESRLRSLLQSHRFTTMSNVLAQLAISK
ncbi:Peptidoglycan deacetylase [Novipirellula galeiformis]|uniref:Peptidoglycan deacetylase n=1 Tax=Novipirellula galeiformis TaxID=2528004 RepID=A0A5C6CEJ3_9BACT|nr:XrtA system polysaccharide deacetylase [Novipirellula galeiformis]TWU21229.1 Peptidoglycan deacetylase [Novipirellula galeiformis]